MKTRICIFSLLLAASLPAWASLSFSSSTPTAIPDNSIIGTGSALSFSGSGATSITDVALSFTLQGGFASDLTTAYLRLDNGSSSYYDLKPLIGNQSLSTATPYTLDFNTADFKTVFDGKNPTGAWTLFFADSVPGDQTTVNGWSLNITAVPEPVTLALGLFVAMLLSLSGLRWAWQTKS